MLCLCRHPQLNGDYRSITSSQTTTEADNSFAEGVEPKGEEAAKAMDPALLQVLSYAANLTFQEEEDALGKVGVGGREGGNEGIEGERGEDEAGVRGAR